MKLKLYLISQSHNRGYDTYDSAVVCAPSPKAARQINPRDGLPMTAKDWERSEISGDWATAPDQISVLLIGQASHGKKRGLILASFNAG